MGQADVHDKNSFARFVADLIADFDDPAALRTWPNRDLRSVLVAMEAWASDSERPASANPWRHAAEVLGAGRTYE